MSASPRAEDPPAAPLRREELRRAVADRAYWYHTMRLPPGVLTPGHFDARTATGDLPWPDLAGRRCLDVGTFDGFWAFEMERRGAAEVVAVDIDDSVDLDWIPREVPAGFRRGQEPVGDGFALAARQLRSGVERVTCNVYDLDPGRLGTFDVVVCGTLLQHLRDPFLALQRIRSVCRGHLLSFERIDLPLSLVAPRTPLRRLHLSRRTWALPNRAGHRAMVTAAGFDVTASRLLALPHGPGASGHGPRAGLPRLWDLARRLGRRMLTSSPHPPFSALLAAPAPDLPPMPS